VYSLESYDSNLNYYPVFFFSFTTAQLRLVLHLLRCKEKLLVKCAAIYQSSG